MLRIATKLSFHKLFNFARAESETAQFGRNALTDWQIVCCVFFFLNLIAVCVSAFMYQRISNGEIFLVDKKEPVSIRVLNTFELEQTVSFFDEKKANFKTLTNKQLLTSDPYIPKAAPSAN